VSEKMINTDYKQKKLNISVEEAKIHIQKLEKTHGTFCFAESSSLVDLKKPFVYLEKFRGMLFKWFEIFGIKNDRIHSF